MIKVLTFDLDDTLWDVRPALVKAEAAQNTWLSEHFPDIMAAHTDETLLALKKVVLQREPALRHHISVFRETFLRDLLLTGGVNDNRAREAAREAFQVFLRHRQAVAVFPTAQPLLAALHTQFRIGALTNGNADVYQTPLGGYFEFAIKAEDVGASKPDPRLFQEALKRTQVEPQELVHVGDNHDHDVDGALNAGVRSVWLRTDNSDPLEHRADAVITCLSELPRVLERLNQE